MQILPLDKGKFVRVDGDKATVFYLKEVKKCLAEATARLKEIPEPISDEDLLAWARVNYPQVNYEAERQSLEAKVAECKSLLEAIK
jgi:hypothetical protein